MQRNQLLTLLKDHNGSDAHEEEMRQRLIRFVEEHPDCFERSLLSGHVTGSAFIINKEGTKTLLTHHHKLDKWLQLGGHSDGDPDTLQVALREAQEESGLQSIIPLSTQIFDVDIHTIPARGAEPKHFHYDVRFLFQADESEPLVVSAESRDLAWIDIDRIDTLTQEESILRMVKKIMQW